MRMSKIGAKTIAGVIGFAAAVGVGASLALAPTHRR